MKLKYTVTVGLVFAVLFWLGLALGSVLAQVPEGHPPVGCITLEQDLVDADNAGDILVVTYKDLITPTGIKLDYLLLFRRGPSAPTPFLAIGFLNGCVMGGQELSISDYEGLRNSLAGVQG